jgi:hypothetical protein
MRAKISGMTSVIFIKKLKRAVEYQMEIRCYFVKSAFFGV